MLRRVFFYTALFCVTLGTISAEGTAEEGEKRLGGMSIVGNDEAPKALVIVPWKGSELGESPGLSRSLDDGRDPVDRDVFKRELDYYRIRAASTSGAVSSR